MSLSAREQLALNSITDRLANSDPDLAALLATFSRLASGEEMPAAEKLMVGWRRGLRERASRIVRRLGLGGAAMLLWLAITIALIATGVALSNSGGSQSACPETWGGAVCVNSVSTPGSGPAANKPVVSRSVHASTS